MKCIRTRSVISNAQHTFINLHNTTEILYKTDGNGFVNFFEDSLKFFSENVDILLLSDL